MKPIDTTYDAFILANYQFLTLSDLVYETGKNFSFIKTTCRRLDVEPVNRKKQVENFIRDHTHWPLERLAKVLDMGKGHLRGYLEEFDIELKPAPQTCVSKTGRWSAEVFEYIAELYGTITPSNIQRPPAIYNQTGSDFLDNRNGIKTTIRDTPNALKAKIK